MRLRRCHANHLIMSKDIRTLSLIDLEVFFDQINEKKFRAKQVYEWLWKKNAHTFEEMSNLSLPIREQLKTQFTFLPIVVSFIQKSKDGTIKNALKLHDGNIVESVLIPTENRSTACISSQVGCSLDCEFCATAQLKRMRNLSVGEIVDQVVALDKQSREYTGKPLSNIVFMGMGEPLLNYPNIVEAIHKITLADGLGMAPRRITVSTSGIPKMIQKLADENLRVNLAFSLHSAIEKKRNKLMPFSSKFPLEEVLESLQYWYRKTKSTITIEYIIWKGINDQKEDADALVDFCKKIPCKVNLIEYNTVEGSPFEKASESATKTYTSALERNKIIVNVRRSRGKDIDAACGQLSNKNIDL